LTLKGSQGSPDLVCGIRNEVLHQLNAGAHAGYEPIDLVDKGSQLARCANVEERQVKRIALPDSPFKSPDWCQRSPNGEVGPANGEQPHDSDEEKRPQGQVAGQCSSRRHRLRHNDNRLTAHLWIIKSPGDARHSDRFIAVRCIGNQGPNGIRQGRISQIIVSGHGCSRRVDDAVEDAVSLGQRQELKGGHGKLDLWLTLLDRNRIGYLVGRAQQQAIIGLVGRCASREPGYGNENRSANSKKGSDENEKPKEKGGLMSGHE
jgi:hypothetical protein